MTITAEQIIAAAPGRNYPPERIRALIPEPVTPRQIADVDEITAKDRCWILIHFAGISDRDLRLLACRWAEAALPVETREIAIISERTGRQAIEISRKYAKGIVSEVDLQAALKTAWDAARFTALEKATEAALETSWAAVWTTASCAAEKERFADWNNKWADILSDLVRVAVGLYGPESLPPLEWIDE